MDERPVRVSDAEREQTVVLLREHLLAGRLTPEEFEAHRSDIAGRIVLVRHELMFVAGTIHRRRKYNMAVEAGAAGFLIAGPMAGALVTGSSGRNEGDAGIPAAGIAPEVFARGLPLESMMT